MAKKGGRLRRTQVAHTFAANHREAAIRPEIKYMNALRCQTLFVCIYSLFNYWFVLSLVHAQLMSYRAMFPKNYIDEQTRRGKRS